MHGLRYSWRKDLFGIHMTKAEVERLVDRMIVPEREKAGKIIRKP